jgi:hypothetical protein
MCIYRPKHNKYNASGEGDVYDKAKIRKIFYLY